MEEILDSQRRGRGHQVLVKWAGYVEPTWEPLSAVLDIEALARFEAQHGKITGEHVEERERLYPIEAILNVRKRGRGKQLLVKWSGYTEPTWEPLGNFIGTDALAKFEASYGRVRD